MVGPQNAFAVSEVLLEQGNGVVESFRQFVGVGKIVPRNQDVEVIRLQGTESVSENLLVYMRFNKNGKPIFFVISCKVITIITDKLFH